MNKKEATPVVSVSFKLHVQLNQQINEVMVKENYGLRGKSKWIKESIQQLFALPDYIELVALSDDIENAEALVSVRLPRELMMQIEKSLVEIRKMHPEMEGLKSRIIRTAIFQRLIRG